MARGITGAVVTLILATPSLPTQPASDLRSHPRVQDAIGLFDVWTDAQVAYQQRMR